jgi:RHS repeat-associated protein
MKRIAVQLSFFMLVLSMLPSGVAAQMAPTGSHYAGRASDTGHAAGSVGATGTHATSIPLDLPPDGAGLPLPLQIVHSGGGVGAAGLGWEIPLSYVRSERTFAHRRPAFGESVLPAPRQRTQLSLLGQNIDLVRTGQTWVARSGTLALTARESGNSWLVYDGEGRTFTFVRPPNIGTAGLWLLKSVSRAGGARVDLTYAINAVAVTGGGGFEISLTQLQYNRKPAQGPVAGCAKHEIALTYGQAATEPVALSMLPDSSSPLLRKRTLTLIDVKSRAACGAAFQSLRRYELLYRPAVDSANLPEGARIPRLHTVRLFGRQGTPEEHVPLPIATYTYGSATHDNELRYDVTQTIALPADDMASGSVISGAALDGSVVAPSADARYATWHSLTDVTGDGRPEIIFRKNDKLWAALNHPAPGGQTTIGVPLLGSQGVVPFHDAVFQAGAFSTHTATKRRLWYGTAGRNTVDIWRQAIDVNGDGRLDIVDAGSEPKKWIVYLNTPGGPTGIQWKRRVFSVLNLGLQLTSSGHVIKDGFVPLSRRTSGVSTSPTMCLRYESGTWTPIDGTVTTEVQDQNGQAQTVVFHCNDGVTGSPPAPICLENEPSLCRPIFEQEPERTFVEWELSDLNGDGYPDFVFNSSPADYRPEPPVQPTPNRVYVGPSRNRFGPRRTNLVRASFNVVGVRVKAVEATPFAKSVSLHAQWSEYGVGMWEAVLYTGEGRAVQRQWAGLADVNGDGLVDRVVGRAAYLGTFLGTARSFSPVQLTLPGELARQESREEVDCKTGDHYTSTLTQGLRDLTGDGIPDYFDQGRVWIGTGVRFAPSIRIVSSPDARFVFSHQTETCDGSVSNTDAGLFDIDGDGRPEVIGLVALGNGRGYVVSQLAGGSAPGIPEAGRLTAIDNGHGATTSITYRSAKEDLYSPHQVPFAEIVVSSVETTGARNLGGTLLGARYAYGYAEQVFDSALDAFTFAGYQRSVVFQPYADRSGRLEGSAIVIDRWPLTPSLTTQERWLRTQRVSLARDVYTVRGSASDPWSLLPVDANDTRVIGVTHLEWDAKRYETPGPATTPGRDCVDMIDPFDFDASDAASGVHGYDVCRTHGFAFELSIESWYGPRSPPTTNNVQTRLRTLDVDDFGRVLFTQHDNDVLRSDDDVCVENLFAVPNGTFPRVLSALASRRISDCGRRLYYAGESWRYDGLAAGVVSSGRTTSHTVQRIATDNGALLRTVKAFDATYDAAGNLVSMTTERGGATRTVRFAYDPFGLVVVRANLEASGLPPTESSVRHDPVSLERVVSTDPYGTEWGTQYDGYGRRLRATVQRPGDTLGVTSATTYLGFAGTDPAGRRVVSKAFTDPVAPAAAATLPGRTSTLWLDELGRPRRADLDLGSDYNDDVLVLGSRIYDGMGRVAFEADPHRRSDNASTVYGTSYHFKNTGDPDCFVRGRGPQPRSNVTDAAAERFPTCFERSFVDQVETVDVRDAASLQAGSPQAGVVHRVVSSAIGRILERSTLKGGVRIEHAAFSSDRLGQQTSMTRFTNPVTSTGSLQWTWRVDSIGQLLELQEPEAATRFYDYSDWGEQVATRWQDGNIDRRLINAYDALGRLTSEVELADGTADPETLNEYTYDAAVNITPLMTPTFVVGRLASARSPGGQVALSYDAFGRVNARAFADDLSGLYIERTQHHADGSLESLELNLPDRNYAREQVKYGHDSAGRLRTVTYVDPVGTRELYRAETIDAFGRVRTAVSGGQTKYAADYAEEGRRLVQGSTVESTLGSLSINFLNFDAVGRELSRRELLDGSPDGRQTDVAYDALGRLATAVQTAPSGPLSNWAFSYDAIGNILRLSDAVGAGDAAISYRSGDRDRVCRVAYGNGGLNASECNIEYDVLGNVVRQPTRTGSRQLTYFGSGLVRSISEQGIQARFKYDAFGEVQELDVQGGTGTQDNRRDRRYGDFIERRDAMAGASPASFIMRHIPGDGGLFASKRGPDDVWVFHFGELRGGRLFTDVLGAFVQRIDYQPFGEATSSGLPVGSPSHTSYQWNGGDGLDAFGLTQLGARLYDPVMGRFLGRDPLFVPRGATTTNPYAFAMNDPVNGADPTGLDCVEGKCPPLTPVTPFGGGAAGSGNGSGAVHVRPGDYSAIQQIAQLGMGITNAIVMNLVFKPALRERSRLDWERFKRESKAPSRLDCFTSARMFGECAGNGAAASATVGYHFVSLPYQMLLGMADDSGGRTQKGYVHPFDRPFVNLETGEGFENLGAPGGPGAGGFGGAGGGGAPTPRSYGRSNKLEQAKRQGGNCEYCGQKMDLKKPGTPSSMHGDHILPYWLHRFTELFNLASTCRTCNLSKGGKTIGPGPNEWWPPLWGPRPKIKD